MVLKVRYKEDKNKVDEKCEILFFHGLEKRLLYPTPTKKQQQYIHLTKKNNFYQIYSIIAKKTKF